MTDNKDKEMQTNVEAEENAAGETTDEVMAGEEAAEEVITEEVVVEEVYVEETVDVAEADEAAETIDVAETDEQAETMDAGEAVVMAPAAGGLKKKGRCRGFFKSHKLGIGIAVLIVLLVANVSVFGLNKFSNKGHRDHGGKTVEREYKQGGGAECGYKDGYANKDKEAVKDAGKAPRAEKAPRSERESRGEKALRNEEANVQGEANGNVVENEANAGVGQNEANAENGNGAAEEAA